MNNQLQHYIDKHPMFKTMYDASAWNESDILFLISNNQKRRLGLPLTHIQGGHKRQKKNKRKHYIYVNKSFNVIEQMTDNIINSSRFEKAIDKFFDDYIDFKNVEIGEEVKFCDIDIETARRT